MGSGAVTVSPNRLGWMVSFTGKTQGGREPRITRMTRIRECNPASTPIVGPIFCSPHLSVSSVLSVVCLPCFKPKGKTQGGREPRMARMTRIRECNPASTPIVGPASCSPHSSVPSVLSVVCLPCFKAESVESMGIIQFDLPAPRCPLWLKKPPLRGFAKKGKVGAMRIFISAGEPSGDIHGSNLVRALREACPDVECVGFGGERMEQAGCKLLYPLCRLAIMWFARVLANAPKFLSLVSQADRYFRHHRPDAVVLIDYPGFHWWLARRAHFHGIPVFYFVPPQLWAWAGWRVKKMRRFVDHVLCSLPFEEPWYRERGVSAEYVGHPFFDELPRQKLDSAFLAEQRSRPEEIIGFLPGSRTLEVQRNFPTQLRAAQSIHHAHPETRFLVACFKESQRKMAEEMRRSFSPLPMQLFVHKTPEI